jgi:hypothetical protein
MRLHNQIGTYLIAACMAVSSVSFAQVKIGTNPTAIEANSNLEVEASTAGRKVKVDKTSGQVTIADGTQGAGKVLTSDVNGGASWQNGVPCNSAQVRRSAPQNVPINSSELDPFTALIADMETYDIANAYNVATGVYTVPATGFYMFVGSSVDRVPGVTAQRRNSTLLVNSNLQGEIAKTVQQDLPYNYGTFQNVSGLVRCTAGEQISFLIQVQHIAASGTKPQPTIAASDVKFSASRVDCSAN